MYRRVRRPGWTTSGKRGNEANHEINIMVEEDASELLEFCGMLLKLIYEYPAVLSLPAVTATLGPRGWAA